jgi:phosphate-selective porin OprO/OprP
LLLRRVRPIVEGELPGQLHYFVMPDFGEGKAVLREAWATWRPASWLRVRVGKFKVPMSLDRLQSDAHKTFVEGSSVLQLAPNRDIGVELSGALADRRMGYELALVNGNADNSTTDVDGNRSKDVAARLWLQPWATERDSLLHELLVGAAVGYGLQEGAVAAPALPLLKSAGQQTVWQPRAIESGKEPLLAHGARTRWTLHGHWYGGPLSVLAEYLHLREGVAKGSQTADLQGSAWTAQVGWAFGGKASFTGVTANQPFALGQPGWGALEVALRATGLDLADAGNALVADPAKSVQRSLALAAGLHWTWSRYLRLLADAEQTTFDGGAAAGGNRAREQVVLGRVQLTF